MRFYAAWPACAEADELKLKLSLVGLDARILKMFDLNMFSFLEQGDSMWSVGELYLAQA